MTLQSLTSLLLCFPSPSDHMDICNCSESRQKKNTSILPLANSFNFVNSLTQELFRACARTRPCSRHHSEGGRQRYYIDFLDLNTVVGGIICQGVRNDRLFAIVFFLENSSSKNSLDSHLKCIGQTLAYVNLPSAKSSECRTVQNY